MRNWLAFVDISGSLLAGAKAEIAGECLRFLLQEKSIEPDNIYLWGEDILPWIPKNLQNPVEWRGNFTGTCRIESLIIALQTKGDPAVVISDGYAFYDASPQDKRLFKDVKTDTVLLLLEQERRLNLKSFWQEDAIFSPDALSVLSDRLREDGQRI